MADDIFPTFDDSETFSFDTDSTDNAPAADPVPYGIAWAWDFAQGDLKLDEHGNTSIVSGLAAVNEWILHTLSIRRFESPIYDENIGTDIETHLGLHNTQALASAVSNEVKEALLVHDRIAEVNVVAAFPVKSNIYMYIQYTTDDGIIGEANVGVAR